MQTISRTQRKVLLGISDLIVDGDFSANYTTDSVRVEFCDRLSIQLVAVGDAVGDVFIEQSIDGTTWYAPTTASMSLEGVDASSLMLADLYCKYIRLNYVHTSGASVAQSKLFAKSLSR
jgi:hypothetical protein